MAGWLPWALWAVPRLEPLRWNMEADEQAKPSTSASTNGPLSVLRSAIAGPIAGVCSRLFTYPPDTIKARLQVQGATPGGGPVLYSGTWSAVRHIARHEGLKGFYRGFGAVAVGSVPANLAYFGGYEAARSRVPATWGLGGDMLVGAAAQLVAGVVFTPLDIVKERLQVAPLMKGSYSYRGPGQALKELVLRNGPLGLFKGYWATNAVWLPWNILFTAAYEGSKRMAAGVGVGTRSGQEDDTRAEGAAGVSELSPLVLGLCSAGSASLAGVLTHPADVVKTRLQVLSACAGHAHVTAWSLAQQMWRTEGPKVFMTGVGARILQLAPGTALSWVVYEPVKRLMAPEALT